MSIFNSFIFNHLILKVDFLAFNISYYYFVNKK